MNKDFNYPFKSFKEVFTLLYLTANGKMNNDLDFITTTINKIFKSQYDTGLVSVAISKFQHLMGFDFITFGDHVQLLEKEISLKDVILEPPYKNCRICCSYLINNSSSNVTLFSQNNIRNAISVSKYCKFCKILYNVDTYEENKVIKVYDFNAAVKFVQTSQETTFEIKILEDYDKTLARNAVTFTGFVDVFNMDRVAVNGRKLNYKRFEEAWFTWKLRKWILKYSNVTDKLEKAAFNSKNVDNIMETFLPQISVHFVEFWGNVHSLFCRGHELCKSFRKFLNYLCFNQLIMLRIKYV
jgi:hypothetical protein